MSIGLHANYRTFLSDFTETWPFSKNPQISRFMKILPVGAELFHVDELTERHDEASSSFFVIWPTRLKWPLS